MLELEHTARFTPFSAFPGINSISQKLTLPKNVNDQNASSNCFYFYFICSNLFAVDTKLGTQMSRGLLKPFLSYYPQNHQRRDYLSTCTCPKY